MPETIPFRSPSGSPVAVRKVLRGKIHRATVTEAVPNAGHRALVQLAAQYDDFTLITQNVDGLHQAAGSRRVLEIHGNLRRAACADCGRREDIGALTAALARGAVPEAVWTWCRRKRA